MTRTRREQVSKRKHNKTRVNWESMTRTRREQVSKRKQTKTGGHWESMVRIWREQVRKRKQNKTGWHWESMIEDMERAGEEKKAEQDWIWSSQALPCCPLAGQDGVGISVRRPMIKVTYILVQYYSAYRIHTLKYFWILFWIYGDICIQNLFPGVGHPARLCSAGSDTPQDFDRRGIMPSRMLICGVSDP